eukprot:comp20817_c1_seq1/m.27438 comp20817_c1_seq1/g.27438  ORF comp20817_c1_seq1/g.27438 comp20817_c1_seq1/m.27438 type:complete len:236 (-) comp20817_c1_seq1:708-1415(-)
MVLHIPFLNAKGSTQKATDTLDRGQLLYILAVHSALPCIFTGVANGLIAFAMFKGYTTVTAFGWTPVPLVGDFVLSTFIQQTILWVVTGMLVASDVTRGRVAPIKMQLPGWLQRPWVYTLAASEDLSRHYGMPGFWRVLGRALLRGLVYSALCALLFVPHYTVVLVLREHYDRPISAVPSAVVFKSLGMALMAALTGPIAAFVALRTMRMSLLPSEPDIEYQPCPSANTVCPENN